MRFKLNEMSKEFDSKSNEFEILKNKSFDLEREKDILKMDKIYLQKELESVNLVKEDYRFDRDKLIQKVSQLEEKVFDYFNKFTSFDSFIYLFIYFKFNLITKKNSYQNYMMNPEKLILILNQK